MKRLLVKAGLVLISGLALQLPVQAQGVPEISPALKDMLTALPIAGLKGEVTKLIGSLKKTACANLTGCYGTQATLQVPNLGTVPVQLYFFTSSSAQQTFLLVVNHKLEMPTLLKANVQKLLNGTVLTDPIFSISTSDFDLATVKMPPDLQKVVRNSYFNVNSLSFASGVQLAARADVGGLLKTGMAALGVKSDQMTLRAGVVMPIPTDIKGAAGSGVGLAQALKDSNTMKDAGADALKPEAYIELQFGPDAAIQLVSPPVKLTDATFFLTNKLIFGYKGNATLRGVSKTLLMQFQTPVTAAGVMDFADFSFRMATPPSLTLEDAANIMVAMSTQDPRLVKYGGGFIGGINDIVAPLMTVAKPLSVFQLNNPYPPGPYKLGDNTKPFPTDDKVFNILLLGPLPVDGGGPLMHVAGNAKILGQTMGKMEVTAGFKGFHGLIEESMNLKIGPLGKVGIKMLAQADVDKSGENIRLKGNFLGRTLEVALKGTVLTIDSPGTCATPFEIKSKAEIIPTLDLAHLLDLEAGVNVDPSKLSGCVGQDLEKALTWVTTTGKNLTGYTASAASAELTNISNAAAEAARQTYENTKNAARNVANSSSNAANNALKAADNAFKGFGKKKKHKSGPDPKFASTVFDWDYYYDRYPELVAQGVDLATHWRDTGFAQGRQGSFEFNATFYIKRYADVQRACSGNLQCALQHWLDFGIDEGRQATWEFSISSYLARYADLRANYPNGDFAGSFEHWFATGIPENRIGTPLQQWNGTLQGPVVVGGGSGQALWNDINSCIDAPISAFKLRYGGSIDAIQFGYHNRGWASVHGNQTNDFTEEVGLPPDEHFTEVRVGAGSRVDNITFYTNKGRKFGPYGGGQPNGGYKAEPGESIGCMAGRSGGSVDQLIFTSTGPR